MSKAHQAQKSGEGLRERERHSEVHGYYGKMKGLSLNLKGRLYSAFVHSEMLYNRDVWNITKSEFKNLEAKNVYLIR